MLCMLSRKEVQEHLSRVIFFFRGEPGKAILGNFGTISGYFGLRWVPWLSWLLRATVFFSKGSEQI